ncbi:hypothetical protein BGZ88_002224 [Linnemannia elongata]|nr:hypothetical protein BGZ88_002224 [Linnemannia elongata]
MNRLLQPGASGTGMMRPWPPAIPAGFCLEPWPARLAYYPEPKNIDHSANAPPSIRQLQQDLKQLKICAYPPIDDK